MNLLPNQSDLTRPFLYTSLAIGAMLAQPASAQELTPSVGIIEEKFGSSVSVSGTIGPVEAGNFAAGRGPAHLFRNIDTAAGALWRFRGQRNFSFDMLKEWPVLRVLLLVMGIHSLWNSSVTFPLVGDFLGSVLKYGILGLLGWILVLLLIQSGLGQVEKAQAEPEPDLSQDAEGPEAAEAMAQTEPE